MYSNIDAERSRLGWTRSRLADYLDTSGTSIKNWIRGTTELPASKLIKMAQLFGCSTDYLLGLDDTWKKVSQSGTANNEGR